MDVVGMLEAASLLVPEGIASDDDITVSDVWDHLAHDEWEVALDLLLELKGGWTAPAGFWEGMGAAAGLLGFERSREWCWWRGAEAQVGGIRAELVLRPADETFRCTPIPGAGVLRPMWDIGNRRADGAAALDIARVWVEFAPELAPGEQAPVRLLPLIPARWTEAPPRAPRGRRLIPAGEPAFPWADSPHGHLSAGRHRARAARSLSGAFGA
ncbi:hypothetical protein [Streptomyces kanamyceticus]|uniref:hypothetical protein n=1 Tax=Streptomyces kanamyceticus TaxID=1967 RepID=UPI00168D1505|nr:hypothetical protein [Streptomyces kanamyceticus]